MTSSRAPYLLRLAERLSGGLASMDAERKARHRNWILSQQKEDGGWGGRLGDSDLYYTSFAVRGLGMLDGMSEDECSRVAGYLRGFDWRSLGVIDLMNWLYTVLAVQAFGGEDLLAGADPDWPQQIAEKLEALRRDDGGYAKSEQGARSSTYHSFLVTLTDELLGMQPPNPKGLIQFVYNHQRDDGGFVEIALAKHSGTNPTAAAVGTLSIVGGFDGELRSDVREYLQSTWSAEGGFQANLRIAMPDVLSTFTGLLTLQDLEIDDLVSERSIERFLVEWLEFPPGGFRAASWDQEADVEYTFYGLACLALLWSR
jgi:geranylgeranyl transferase type-2 subunit beta